MRLHTKIILLIVTVTLGAGLGSSLLVSRMMHDALDSELRDQAMLAVESLAERVTYHVIDDEVIEAREAARKMMERSESIQYVYIIDFDGRLFAHTFEGGFPKALVADTLQHDPMYAQSPRIVHLEIGTGRVLDIGYPLIDGMAAHVHIGMDEEHTRDRVASLRNGIIGLSLLLAGAGIAIGALVSWRMTRPLSDLAGVMRDFGTRTWEEEVEFRGGGREMAHLTRAFNQMISDRVRAESHRDAALEALQTSRDIQDAILSTTDVLLAYLDKEFNFIAVNQAYADAGRRRREDFIGKNHFDLYPDAENEAIFNKVVETGDAQLFSAKPFEHPDQPDRGTTWWKWSLIPMKDESGNVQTLVFSLLDVTERARAEEQVKASLQEKEVLLQEIHHRVKNNLAVISSLLSFQAEITPDERVRAAFQESQNRIRAMARIHEHLYRFSDLARIDMAQYVRGVANHLGQSFGMQAITLQVDVADVELDIDRAMPCGLIINELASNALKHAFPSDWHPADSEPKVCIGMRLHGGECELTVSDNGVGLPPDFQIEGVGHESLGLRLAGILGRQLNGDLQASAEGGTTFRITFAIPER